MKLIDKAALVAEIEKLVDKGKYHDGYDCGFRDGTNYALDALKEKINTLEVKEVDLEKEISQQIEKYYDECENKLANMSDDDTDISFLTLNQFAKHMWELGFKAALKGE